MTAEQFAYWFQGFAELNGEPPSADQWRSIKEHLQTVFIKVTPAVRQSPGYGLGPHDVLLKDQLLRPAQTRCSVDSLIC